MSTDGARRLSVRDREMTYLCSREYSRAEIVYRKALRRIGSVFDDDAGRGDTDELGPDDWKLADLELLARAPAPAPVLEAIAVVLLVFLVPAVMLLWLLTADAHADILARWLSGVSAAFRCVGVRAACFFVQSQVDLASFRLSVSRIKLFAHACKDDKVATQRQREQDVFWCSIIPCRQLQGR